MSLSFHRGDILDRAFPSAIDHAAVRTHCSNLPPTSALTLTNTTKGPGSVQKKRLRLRLRLRLRILSTYEGIGMGRRKAEGGRAVKTCDVFRLRLGRLAGLADFPFWARDGDRGHVGWSLRCGRCRFMVMEVVPRALKRQKKTHTDSNWKWGIWSKSPAYTWQWDGSGNPGLGLFVNLSRSFRESESESLGQSDQWGRAINEDAQPIRTRVKSISISNRPHRHAEPKTLALYSILYTLYSSLRRDPRLLKWLLHIKRWRLLHIHKENKVT